MANKITTLRIQAPGPPGPTGSQGPPGPAANINATSTTAVTIGTGSKTFTTQAGKTFVLGQFVVVTRTAAPTTHWMYGRVTSYAGTTLIVDVLEVAGAGLTSNNWTITVSGPVGPAGPISGLAGTGTAGTAARSDHHHDSRYYTTAVIDAELTALAADHNARKPLMKLRPGEFLTTIDHGFGRGSPIASSNYVANQLRLVPIYVPFEYTVNAVSFNVMAAASIGGQARVGLYTMDRSVTLTALRHTDFGSVAVDSTGVKSIAFAPITLAPGWYWLAINFSATTGIANCDLPADGMYLSFSSMTLVTAYFRNPQAFGAMPATAAMTNVSGNMPVIGLGVQ